MTDTVSTSRSCAKAGSDVTTLRQKIDSLPPERREKVLRRTAELIAEEKAAREAKRRQAPRDAGQTGGDREKAA